jgi:Domain of unknown function (DUF6795)
MRKYSNLLLRLGRFIAPAGFLILLAAATGCGGKFKPVPVKGVVTLDGTPVKGATVYFYAVGDERDGRPAYGATDENGEFQLSTMGNNDGALPRKYKVVIAQYVPSRPDLKIPDFPNTPEGREAKSDFMYRNFEEKGIQPFVSKLPAIYGDSNTTPLECEVKGKMTVNFELKSQ